VGTTVELSTVKGGVEVGRPSREEKQLNHVEVELELWADIKAVISARHLGVPPGVQKGREKNS
jgi:hypothetical protein